MPAIPSIKRGILARRGIRRLTLPGDGESVRIMQWVGIMMRGRTTAVAMAAAALVAAGAVAAEGEFQDSAADWWSLRPVAAVAPPLRGHPVDAFVTVALRERGLTMSPPADARTLCRRVCFDLTGLPPSPEEIDAFERESGSDPEGAFRSLVDRLLASPRYAERWARHWLDVVHYADTHGFDKDKPRPNAWPYRDFVIRALHEDKPYARFVEEQIAGDVLYPGTRDGIEALGFLSAGPWDFIGHEELPEERIDGMVARDLDRDDMVGNAAGTFLSVTVQCARCHNHKFDPIPAEDYFSLQAVFSALDRADRAYDTDPEIARRRSGLQEAEKALLREQEEVMRMIAERGGEELAALDARIAAAEKDAPQGVRPEYGWHSPIEASQDTLHWVQVDLGRPVPVREVVLAGAWDDFNGIGAGFGFPVRFRVEGSRNAGFSGDVVTIAARDLEDFPNPGTAPASFPAPPEPVRFVRVTATKSAPRRNDFVFALAELQVFDAAGRNLAEGAPVAASGSIEAPVRWAARNLTDGIFPAATGGEVAALRRAREEVVARRAGRDLIDRRDRIAASLGQVRTELRDLPPQQLVYAGTVHTGSGNFRGTGASGGRPRPIYVLARGDVTKPGREVGPGALSAVRELPHRFDLPPDAPEGARRAALARWITDPRNPLTWRSIVNRVWQYHFGQGIVDTPGDFGRMGSLPSHPELLDWLAAWFRDSGGSLKDLHRLILTSAAWRQSSSVRNDAAHRIDAGNRLLWRQNRRKLEAEAVRDSMLAVSGCLDLTMGGPGWQDFEILHPEHSPHYRYDLADPEDRRTWRRAIYRFTVRSQMQPFLTALDCADPSIRVDTRNQSGSPAQALTLLNSGFAVTQAVHFARRVEREAGPGLPGRIDHACRLALGHALPPEDRGRLIRYAAAHGLAGACRILFNLNEFTFVD